MIRSFFLYSVKQFASPRFGCGFGFGFGFGFGLVHPIPSTPLPTTTPEFDAMQCNETE